jgi:MarR family transcriptional regulator, organic hydroperoxide resistance regulator
VKNMTPEHRVQWLTDLVRLEIVLWDQIDARLRQQHALPLSYFETLYMVSRAPRTGLRIGDLAERLRITVGGTSKLADRIEAAGLIRRVADPADRRASRIVLTPAGRRTLASAIHTYSTDLAATLDPALTGAEQQQLHDLVRRLLAATTPVGPDDDPTAPARSAGRPT